ncbi:hypothetical protein BPO_p0034 (plasmid) [Bergeyella porcorum]|uniref:The BURPS668_1122 family of deaminases n=1 Tax=Bergeyella porcorum TaxID=1735111 RepID=A0AAU0F4Q2_9FLAO
MKLIATAYLNLMKCFYHYKGDNYWWVDGNWYIEGNTYQCSGKAFDCFLIYDYNTAKYIPAKIEIGTSIGEDTAQFITYLLVRDIPLMLIGSGGGTIYEVALNTLADPLISYLNATDKITDEQALAAGLTTILAGNVKHLTPENITKIKTVLTEKVKIIKQKTGKNAKDIAFELKDKIKTIANKEAIQREVWNGAKNIFKATDEEIADATKRIKDYRTKNNLKGKNIGYLEGNVNGKTIDNKMWRSGEAKPEIEPQIFKAIKVEGSGGRSWLRNTDSEYKMLNQLAKDLGGKVGNTYPNIKGEIKIISELPYCDSCTGVIQQFNEMFPNIKIILVDGVK